MEALSCLTASTHRHVFRKLVFTQLMDHLRSEPFFKWLKQNFLIKAFFGTFEDAVKSQIWIAVSVYMLIAIIKKRPDLKPTSTLFYRF